MVSQALKFVVGFALAVALPTSLFAQDAAGSILTLTLDEAIARGLKASHRIDEISARSDAASAAVQRSHATALPQVSAQAGYTRTNHVDEFGLFTPDGQFRVLYPDVPDNVRARVDMQWAVYTGGRQQAVERAARTEASALAVDREALSADLRLEITRAYWAYFTAIEAARVVQEALVRTDVHLSDARNLQEAGLVAPNDVLAAEAQQARQLVMRIRADAQRDSAEAELARLTGADRGVRIRIPAPTPSTNSPAARLSMEALIEQARAERRDRAALVERLAAANARHEAARFGMRPTIAVGGGIDYARPNPRIFPRRDEWEPSWDASVNVNWPLADGGRTRAEVAEAAAAARAVEARLAEFDSLLSVDIAQRMRDVDAARAAVDAAESGVRAASEARRVAADRFAAGVATSTDVLNAQGALLDAELDRTRAEVDARLADARLARTLGR
jgi:outer membrane protein TolC